MKSKLLIILTTAILSLTTNVTFGQVAPTLGATSSFALFTGTGAFDNLGASVITGNVGSHAYSATGFTGFPLGTVVGNIYNASDGITATAAADVLTAYAALTQAGTVKTGLLDGKILTTGIYEWGSATSLSASQTFTLDGGGNPNAKFIIRIGGAFSTGTFANIVLTGSAQFCNVYWQVNGAFTLGDGSVFRGTLIATGAIHLLEASSLYGRALSTTGAIDTHNNVVSFMPAAAGTITGTASVCQGQTGVTYSVPAIANAIDYIWTLPAGASITAGTNTNNITLTYSGVAASGNMTVQGSNACGTGTVSANYAVTVNPVLPASVIIAAFPSGSICAGTSVTFTATPTNGGTTPAYQWKKGGTDISGETNSTYTSTTLANTDAITVVMTSNATPCLTGSPATSNTVTMTVTACGLVADFTGTPLAVYIGSTVTFTNASTGTSGSTAYSWDFGTGASIATAATIGPHVVSYSTSGSKTVTLTITDGTSDTKTKTNYITVNPLLIASVSIASAPSGAICSGTSVTFTATPTNGGTTPTFIWKKGGVTITGETGVAYISSTLLNGDVITVEMTSNEVFVTGNPATSAPVTMVINPIPAAPITGKLTQTDCFTATGSVLLSGLPATGTWTITRTPGGTTTTGTGTSTTVTGVPIGTSTFTVTDGITLCTSLSSSAVVINPQPIPAAPTVTLTQPDCTIATGTILITAPIGAGMTYSIDGTTYTNTSGIFSNVPMGTYTVTAKNADGCISKK